MIHRILIFPITNIFVGQVIHTMNHFWLLSAVNLLCFVVFLLSIVRDLSKAGQWM